METVHLVQILVCWSLLATLTSARGAGRAFPIAAENFVVDNFQKINPSIEWDESNFLVDLSGYYANCKALKKPQGIASVDRKTPDGATVVAVVGSIEGSGTDVTATTMYIEELLKRWMSAQTYHSQVKESGRFGCSVRPGCDGYVVVACLFAPAVDVQKDKSAPPQLRQSTTRLPPPPTTRKPTTTTTTTQAPETEPPVEDVQRALAFTPEQYDVASKVLGKAWDKSHYLENLSGFETDCSMIDTTNWNFDHTNRVNRQQRLDIKGQYGYSRNKGSTPEALVEILGKFEPVPTAKDLGCSLIPDCIEKSRQQMYVVVSCLYEE
jgi:hypothetical protein